MLHFVADHDVDTVDMYRLGRYVAGRARPVLVKLRPVWDKRILQSRCSKLG